MRMGLIGNLLGATIKVVASPIAVVKDVVSITTGTEANNTSKLLEDAGKDISKAVDKLEEGKIL